MREIEFDELLDLARNANGQIEKIFAHWSAGFYETKFDHYHINIDAFGKLFIDGELTDSKAHTWHRNTGAIGIAPDCCYGATTNDLGDYAPTSAQIESLSRAIACLCTGLSLEISKDTVMTHAEAADLDGYGINDSDPEMRWDLLFLVNGDEFWSGGNILRGKAIWYQQNYYKEG